jgi:predicted nucleic acid-binding protein
LIIDTDILIDASRRITDATDFLSSASASSLPNISAITQMELLVGCRNTAEQRALAKFLARFQIVPINVQISDTAVKLLTEYNLSHGLLIADSLIAATALTLDEEFATKNERDFRFIPGLNLIGYPA